MIINDLFCISSQSVEVMSIFRKNKTKCVVICVNNYICARNLDLYHCRCPGRYNSCLLHAGLLDTRYPSSNYYFLEPDSSSNQVSSPLQPRHHGQGAKRPKTLRLSSHSTVDTWLTNLPLDDHLSHSMHYIGYF